MPDNLSPEDRRKAMRAVKGSNTSLERAVDAAFRERGWACERHVADLPGKPDFVFVEARLVVFVDGDFWHGWRFPLWCAKLTPYWEAEDRAHAAARPLPLPPAAPDGLARAAAVGPSGREGPAGGGAARGRAVAEEAPVRPARREAAP